MARNHEEIRMNMRITMAQQRIVLVTGASSGSGRLAVEAFAADGRRVFGTLRNTTTFNAAALATLRDASVEAAATTILAAGTRPLRTTVPANPAAEAINAAVASIQISVLAAFGLGDLANLRLTHPGKAQ